MGWRRIVKTNMGAGGYGYTRMNMKTLDNRCSNMLYYR
jgi:hypothetical protein